MSSSCRDGRDCVTAPRIDCGSGRSGSVAIDAAIDGRPANSSPSVLFKDRADPVDECAHLWRKILAVWVHDGNSTPDRLNVRQDLHELAIFKMLGDRSTEGLNQSEPRERACNERFGIVHEDR